MKLRIILSILIFISFAYAVVLPSSWGFCFPDGCVFASINECNKSSCFSEDISSHISERAVLLDVIFNNVSHLPFFLFAVFLFALYKILLEYFNIAQLIQFKLYRHFSAILNNLFITLFSKGLLHPKTY